MFSSRGSSQPRDQTRVSGQAGSLSLALPGKPIKRRSYEIGSCSLRCLVYHDAHGGSGGRTAQHSGPSNLIYNLRHGSN